MKTEIYYTKNSKKNNILKFSTIFLNIILPEY